MCCIIVTQWSGPDGIGATTVGTGRDWSLNF